MTDQQRAERSIAEMNAQINTTEFQQRYQQLLAHVTEQIWQHGYVVLKNGDDEILIDYRDR